MAARKIIASKYPQITCAPCAAHCLDLLLEDIGKLPWIASVLSEGHNVAKFITTHHASLAYFRSHSTLQLLKPGETRFATNFIMLQRLLQCKDALQETVVSREFKQWLANRQYKEKGSAVTDTVLRQGFWDEVKTVVDICAPIVTILRLADGPVPSTGKMYWKIFRADLDVQESSLSAGGCHSEPNRLSCRTLLLGFYLR